jgi:transcriptional antiterminator Rof (Rho-off)
MGGIFRQDEIGRCDFLDVLEEAVLTRRPVTVKLRNGDEFIDQVRDVKTENGEDYAVFLVHDRVNVSDIHGCSRAEPEVQPPLPH